MSLSHPLSKSTYLKTNLSLPRWREPFRVNAFGIQVLPSLSSFRYNAFNPIVDVHTPTTSGHLSDTMRRCNRRWLNEYLQFILLTWREHMKRQRRNVQPLLCHFDGCFVPSLSLWTRMCMLLHRRLNSDKSLVIVIHIGHALVISYCFEIQ